MTQYYRIAAVAAAFWIYAGLIAAKIFRIRKLSCFFPASSGRFCLPADDELLIVSRRKQLRREILRLCADFLVFLILFLPPLYTVFFSHPSISYAGFVVRFSLLAACSLIVSVIVDRVLRRKHCRDSGAGRDTRLKDFIREVVTVLIAALGITVFSGVTFLSVLAGASIPLQILLSAAALAGYRSVFLLIRRIRMSHTAVRNGSQPKYPPGTAIRKTILRGLQAGTVLYFWIRIVQHIEKEDFPAIQGVPDHTAAALCILTLVACAWMLAAGLQLLCSETSRKKLPKSTGPENQIP